MNGMTLKLIAASAMLIDHIGAVLFPQYLWMRIIGRIAFPLYCFLLIEGYKHTHSIRNYLVRLGAFALISELPFDLAFNGSYMYLNYQNVFFTLFLGLLSVWLCDYIKSLLPGYGRLAGYGVFVAAGIVAELLKTDYGCFGIMLILVFYEFQENKMVEVLLAGIVYWSMTLIEIFALAAFLPIFLYNGKKGPGNKAVSMAFYLFYPVHLLILYLITLFI